jgi:hypothetical protein
MPVGDTLVSLITIVSSLSGILSSITVKEISFSDSQGLKVIVPVVPSE